MQWAERFGKLLFSPLGTGFPVLSPDFISPMLRTKRQRAICRLVSAKSDLPLPDSSQLTGLHLMMVSLSLVKNNM